MIRSAYPETGHPAIAAPPENPGGADGGASKRGESDAPLQGTTPEV